MEGIRGPERFDSGAGGKLDVGGPPVFHSDVYLPQPRSEDAKSIVDEYYRKQGGRPEKPAKKRKSAAEKAATEKDEPKRRRKSKGATGTATPEAGELGDWVPKGKSWENDVSYVDTVHRDPPDPLYAYLVWKNGTKSRVLAETCYHKCPMKASCPPCFCDTALTSI